MKPDSDNLHVKQLFSRVLKLGGKQCLVALETVHNYQNNTLQLVTEIHVSDKAFSLEEQGGKETTTKILQKNNV